MPTSMPISRPDPSHPPAHHDHGASRHVRPDVGSWIVAAAVVPTLLLASACGGTSSADPSTSEVDRDYCAALEGAKADFGTVQSGAVREFDEAFATFHAVADEAPDDVATAWDVFDGAILGLEQDLAAIGLEVADLAAITSGEIPEGTDPDELAAVPDLLTGLVTEEVAAAANDIEQHAFDVCGIELTT